MYLSKRLLLWAISREPYNLTVAGPAHVDDERRINAVRILSTAETRDDALYIATPEYLLSATALPEHLFIAGIPAFGRIEGAIYVDATQQELLNVLLSISEHYNALERALYDACLQGEPLASIMDCCAAFFDGVAFIVDDNYRIITHSAVEGISDLPGSLLKAFEAGEPDKHIFSKIRDAGYIKASAESHEPFFAPMEGNERHSFLQYNFYDQNLHTASLIFHEASAELDSSQTVLARQIGRILDAHIFKGDNDRSALFFELKQTLLLMLDGVKPNELTLGPSMKKLGWNIDDDYLLLVIQNDERTPESPVTYNYGLIRSFFPDNLHLSKKGISTLVINASRLTYNLPEALERLSKLLQQMDDRVAVTRTFHRITSATSHFNAALETLRIGRRDFPERRLYMNEDFAVLHILDICEKRIDTSVFCRESALLLDAYDHEHDSELLETIYTYLKNNHSIAASAEELVVHRNTVIYRLKKAQELTGVDFTKSGIDMQFLLSYEILRYKEVLARHAT